MTCQVDKGIAINSSSGAPGSGPAPGDAGLRPARLGRALRPQLHALALALLFATASLGLSACQEPAPPQADDFQLAEERLRAGDYDGATRHYTAFLEHHPHSPLAPMARQRLRNIDRELQAVMGRRATPAPIYIRPEVNDVAPPIVAPGAGDSDRRSERR